MNLLALQHLASAMAHEVRNPLNSMAIHIELLEGRLRKAGLSPEELKAALRSTTVLAAEVERVDKILDEYLTYAAPDDQSRQVVDVRALLEGAIERARPAAAERGVGIALEAAGLHRWSVDESGLSEAVYALVANAVEASARGEGVEVNARGKEGEGVIVVSDRGEGMTAEDLSHAFRIGFSRRGRNGVGLTVAKQIIRGHGGSLTGSSAGPGKGAVFTIRLPL